MRGEKYKVLAGMLALRRFTVDELVHYTRVEEATVRSCIGRMNRILIESGVIFSDKRGGREKIYELDEAQIPAIEGELRDLYDILKVLEPKVPAPPDFTEPIEAPGAALGIGQNVPVKERKEAWSRFKEEYELHTPIALETAEDAVGQQFSELPLERRENFIEIAEMDVAAAWADIEELTSSYGECNAIAEMRTRTSAIEKRIELLKVVIKFQKNIGSVENELVALNAEYPELKRGVENAVFCSKKIADLAVDPVLIDATWSVQVPKISVFFYGDQINCLALLERACVPYTVDTFRIGGTASKSVIAEMDSAQVQSRICVVAIDSANSFREVYTILDLWWAVNQVFVFDAGLNDKLRNHVLSRHAHYEAYACNLSEKAIRGALELALPHDTSVPQRLWRAASA